MGDDSVLYTNFDKVLDQLQREGFFNFADPDRYAKFADAWAMRHAKKILLAAALRYVDPCHNHLDRMLALALGVADVCAELTAAGEEIEVSVPLCIGAIKRLQACVNQLPLALLSGDADVRSCFLHDDCGVVDAIAMLLSTSEMHDSRKRCVTCRGAGEAFFTQGFFRVTRACVACNGTGVAGEEPSDGEASNS